MITKKQDDNLKAGSSIKKFIDNITFGKFVRYVREADGVTQIELASRLGVSKQFMSAVEIGREAVGLDFAKRISEALGYSLAPFAQILINEQLAKHDKTLQVEITKKSA